MTIQEISDLISKVGFPVVVTMLLLYQQLKTVDSYYQMIKQIDILVENQTTVLKTILEKVTEHESK